MPGGLVQEQDRFELTKLCDLIKEKGLPKGLYLMDVGPDKTAKFSRFKRYWITKEEMENQ